MQFNKLRINSIRNKLVISMVAICIIPLIGLGVGSYTQSKTILSNKLNLTSSQTLAAVDNSVSEYFYGLGDMVSLMANDDGFQNAEVDDTMEDVSNILKQVKSVNNNILTDYFVTEGKKFAIYPNEKMPDGYNPLVRPWYKDAIAHPGKVSISMPFKDAKTGQNVVSISKTVEHEGKVMGVVGMSVTLNMITDKIAADKIGKSGYIFMTDINGNIISHPDKTLIGTDTASKLSFWHKVKSTQEGFVTYTYDGIKKFGVYQTNEATGWKLVATLEQSELSNDTKNILQRTIFMILIIGIIAAFLSWLFSRGIANNIKKLKEVFVKASTGDLTVSMEAYTKDEFKDLAVSFNGMMKDISSLMNSVTTSSNTVLSTSTSLARMSETVTESIDEVAKSISQVSQGAVEQAKNSQKSVIQMNDLSDKLNIVSSNSNEMDAISNSAKNLGAQGLNMISMLIEKSNRTKLATNEVDKIVKDMSDRTKEINVISETISNITGQTNLLALNASIESARAGEAGKGFAVVADEIRKLAEQSSASTEEIKNIVANIQNSSDIAVDAIKAAENIVNEQELAVAETKKIFNEILSSIGIMIEKVDEVKMSIRDMLIEKQNTVVEIENISAISEQSASASEEVTASIEEINSAMEEFTNHTNELKTLAKQLEGEINRFKTN